MSDNNEKGSNDFNREEYKSMVKMIVKDACEITKADVGVLFLTSDGFFLEAAHWARWEGMSHHPNPPASELPIYCLHWLEKDDKLLDGITAFVAVRQKTQNLNQDGVFEHPAWKGKWDPVFLEGERKRCKGILAVPIQSAIGADRAKARVHGVLKVENPREPLSSGHFKKKHEDALIILAQNFAAKLDSFSDFWREFVQARADLKVSYMVELLERGRSIQYNLSHSLGYVIKLFQTWLSSEGVAHLFWQPGDLAPSYILSPWDSAKKDSAKLHTEVNENRLVEWLKAKVDPKIVQPNIPIDRDLWNIIFPNKAYKRNVDIIRLKTGKYNLGVIVLSRSPLWKTVKCTRAADRNILEKLTRLAMNVVSSLGRFIQDEYETAIDTYLPEHRPPKTQKTCAILFADIKNFSQLVQILRLKREPQLIEPFIDHFCAEMGTAISETPLGRVEKFLGDGVMALFGEYSSKEHEKVVVAVHCAFKMLERFRKLNAKWIEEGLTHTDLPYNFGLWHNKGALDKKPKPLEDLRKKFNEDVNIDLTIGINIGEIYFDYFGDRTHREYTAIGDHVNFTHRIRGAAGRYDESEHCIRTNIVLSQTAYQFLCDKENRYLLNIRKPFWARFQGFGFIYPVYEVEYDDLDHAKIAETLKNLVDDQKKKKEKVQYS